MQDVTYSIIIPHKNVPDLLRRCLNSIPQRDDVQVIVVDDDSSPEVVDFNHFPGSERNDVECCFTKEGKGAGYARNVGLKHARGKWLLFADADDFFHDGMLSMLDKWKDSECDIIYFKSSSTDSITGNPSSRHIMYNNILNMYQQHSISIEECVSNMMGPISKILSHTFISQNHLFFDEIVCSNDVGFAARSALCINKIDISEDILYNITTRDNSLTNPSQIKNKIYFLRVRLKSAKATNIMFEQNGHSELCYDLRDYALRQSLSPILGFRRLYLFIYTIFLLVYMGLHKPLPKNRMNDTSQYSLMHLTFSIIKEYTVFHWKCFFNGH